MLDLRVLVNMCIAVLRVASIDGTEDGITVRRPPWQGAHRLQLRGRAVDGLYESRRVGDHARTTTVSRTY
jgi:hypothetical protein